MVELGFTFSEMDPCLFLKEITNRIIIVVLYVDDILLGGSKAEELNKISLKLGKHFNHKDSGSPKEFL